MLYEFIFYYFKGNYNNVRFIEGGFLCQKMKVFWKVYMISIDI